MPSLIANSVNLSYNIVGEGEPVLLVPGARATQEDFESGLAPVLRSVGFQTITYDHRGVGHSDPGPEPYTVHDLAADAAGLIDGLGVGPLRVVGISMGAWVTQELALARPDLVRAAGLICTLGRQNSFIRKHYEVVLADESGDAPLPAAARDLLLATTLFSPRTLTSDSLAPELLALSSGGVLGTVDGFVAQLRADIAYDDRVEALAGITCPCLVVAYADDLCTPAALGREVADAIPSCEYVEIPDGGHLGMLENPEPLIEAIVHFLGSVA